MSITLPTTLTAQSHKENWLFQLFNQNSYLSFDGTDDYVDLGATTSSTSLSLTSSTGVSVAMWVNFPVADDSEYIFDNNFPSDSHYAGFAILKGGGNFMGILWGDDTGESPSDYEVMVGNHAVAADTWYFVVITSDFSLTPANTKVYTATAAAGSVTANTVSNQGTASITTPTYTTGNAYFGRGGKTGLYGQVKIKNFGVWNEQITAAEVTALYNSGTVHNFSHDKGDYTSSDNLVSYWEFNSGGSTVYDKKGVNNGTIAGATFSDYLGLSFYDTTVDSVDYYGAVLNNPSIRESISLEKFEAKTSNLSLNCANFLYSGDDFSAEIFGGTNEYINRPVIVYFQPNDATGISDCVKMFTGRLSDFTHDDGKVKLNINATMPWEGVAIPQDRSARGTYHPTVYGNFTINASTYDTPNYVEHATHFKKHLFPVTVDYTNLHYHCPAHKSLDNSTAGQEATLHYYEEDIDAFIPLEDVSASASTSYISSTGHDVFTKYNLVRHFKFKPTEVFGTHGWTNPSYLVDDTDEDDSSSGTNTKAQKDMDTGIVSSASTTKRNDTTFTIPNFSDLPDTTSTNTHGLTLEIRHSVTGFYSTTNQSAGLSSQYYALYDQSFTGSDSATNPTTADGDVIVTVTVSNAIDTIGEIDNSLTPETTSSENQGAAFSTDGYPDGFILRWKRFVQTNIDGGGGDPSIRGYGTLNIWDIRFKVSLKIDKSNNYADWNNRVSSIKELYCGADGLDNSYSGGSGNANTGLEAHRDLLFRFTGYNGKDSEIYNWDDTFPANTDSGSNLDENLSVGDTSIDVNDGSDFQVNDIIKINDEKMLVTNISSNTLTVERAYLGTTAVDSHEDGDDIYILKSTDTKGHRVDSSWGIRYWIDKPKSLESILKQIQREFCFISKFRNNGHLGYILIKDKYSSTDVVATLSKDDIGKVNISNTSFSNLITDMTVNYERHPAKGKYVSSVSKSLGDKRSAYNLGPKENKKIFNLDMLIDKATADMDDDVNDGFTSYYGNMLSDVKAVVSCDVVNNLKGYTLETGDIVQFDSSNMTVDPFGSTWSKYFMVIKAVRTLGKVSIECREVG